LSQDASRIFGSDFKKFRLSGLRVVEDFFWCVLLPHTSRTSYIVRSRSHTLLLVTKLCVDPDPYQKGSITGN